MCKPLFLRSTVRSPGGFNMVQRRPGRALATLVGLPLALLGPTGFALAEMANESELRERNHELERTIEETDDLLGSALNAVDGVIARATWDGLNHVP